MARRDDAAYVEFVGASQRRLRAAAYLMCGDWAVASDLVQEALLRVYVAWPRLQTRGGAHVYARKCLASVAVDRGRRRSSSERPVEAVTDSASPEDPYAPVADREALMAGLRLLGSRQRACVVLRYFEDLSVSETAAALGCSEGTVKSQTARALEHLRRVVVLDELVTEEGSSR